MTPERALAVARQCAAEGRSTPAAVVAVLLAELNRLGEVERVAREVSAELDGSVAELGDMLTAESVEGLYLVMRRI